MTNVHDVDRLTLDGEQNPVHMWLAPVEQMPHLEGKFRILRRQRAALREIGERRDGVLQSQEPAKASIPGMLRYQPIQN